MVMSNEKKTETTAEQASNNDNGRTERKAARAERRTARTAAASISEQQAQENIIKPQGHTPKANTANAMEQEVQRFEKMTYKERLNLYNTNPNKYNQLSKGVKQ
jgi:hypothetical protein